VLDTLAMFDQSVTSKINTTDAGSGPFMVASYAPNADIRMKRFDGYWESGKPYLDEYIVKTIPDTTALAVNLESKAVDAIDGASLYDAVRLKAQPGIVCEVAANQNVFHLAVNVRRQPLSDRKVRQAINYAIDRERCCKTVLQGTVEPTCLHWPRESWAHVRELEGRYSLNVEKAKALLAEAGYPNGFETSILVSKQYNDSLFGIGQIIQSDLAKIGIKAQLKNVEATVYLTTWRKTEWDLAVHNYGRANRDPGTMLSGAVAFYTRAENGPPGFESADFEKWRGEAATILDREKRKPLYRKIQEFFLEDSFSMPIAADQTLWLYRNHINGLSFTRDACPFVSEVWLGG
jgi:peptide/nickel transport system substrate-binding protein